MATGIAAPPSELDGAWLRGMDSALDQRLPVGYFQRSWNLVNRNGALRTRPGTRFLYNLPNANVQAVIAFDPLSGPPCLLVVCDGYVYLSQYPFRRLRLLDGPRMSAGVPKVWHETTIQSVQRNSDGSLTLITPKKVVVLQDGKGPAVYFDGYTLSYSEQPDGIPQGTAMRWSGNRLWVARGNRVFAGDFGNPLSFVEQFYLGGSDSFQMPDQVTGMAELPGTGNAPLLLVFTTNQTVSLRSGILTRADWTSTPDFQYPLFPHTGCVSERSIVAQYGYLWWYSTTGLTAVNLAAQTNVSSALAIADNELVHFKKAVSPGIDRLSGIAFGNMLLMSVPYGDVVNSQTWVLDNTVVQTIEGTGRNAWAGAWTGFAPKEWCKLTIFGEEILYMASIGADGSSQLLELTPKNRSDSGQDIECAVELRAMTGGTATLKGFHFADLTFSDVLGTVDFSVDWRGFSRGQYKRCLDYRAKVGKGSFRFDPDNLVDDDFVVQEYRGQMRRLQTQSVAQATEIPLTTKGTETDLREQWDFGFSFLVRWSGDACLREFSPRFRSETERTNGRCSVDDVAETFTRFDGASSAVAADLAEPVVVYTSTQEVTGDVSSIYGDLTEVTASASASSLITQQAADKMALQSAESQVGYSLSLLAPPAIGGYGIDWT